MLCKAYKVFQLQLAICGAVGPLRTIINFLTNSTSLLAGLGYQPTYNSGELLTNHQRKIQII